MKELKLKSHVKAFKKDGIIYLDSGSDLVSVNVSVRKENEFFEPKPLTFGEAVVQMEAGMEMRHSTSEFAYKLIDGELHYYSEKAEGWRSNQNSFKQLLRGTWSHV